MLPLRLSGRPLDDETLADIAYSFEFGYADGRDPESYTATLQQSVRKWQATGRAGLGSLRYRRGPGFLEITDRRPGLESAEYRLGQSEARVYLACADGATAEEAGLARRPATDLSLGAVEEFLTSLVEARLACEVDGRYLALALPARLPEHG